MILLDTNVVSETMRNDTEPAVRAWLNAQDAQTLYLSAISLVELRFGLHSLPDGHRKDDLLARLNVMLERVFSRRLVAFDDQAAEAYAVRMANARANGLAVSFQDGQIAAIAAARGFAVATRDTSPFEAMGVSVINPWEDARGMAHSLSTPT